MEFRKGYYYTCIIILGNVGFHHSRTLTSIYLRCEIFLRLKFLFQIDIQTHAYVRYKVILQDLYNRRSYECFEDQCAILKPVFVIDAVFKECKTILSVEKFLIFGLSNFGVRGRMKKTSDYRDTRTFERYNLKGAFDR